MNHTKKIIAFGLINTLLFPGVFAASENPIEIQYIKKGEGYNENYQVYLKNSATTLSDLKVTLNDVVDAKIKPVLHKEYLELSNFYKNGGKIVVEKLNNTYKDGGIVTTSDSKTQAVEVRKLDDTYFLGTFSTPTVLGKTAYILKLNKEIDTTNFANKKYELDIAGQVVPLEYYKGNLEEGKYYVEKNEIKFFQKNLTKDLSQVTLKIDGLKSNSITLDKTIYTLAKVKSIDITQGISTKEIRVHIPKDENINKLENFTIYVNNAAIDKGNVTFTDTEMILKYDVSKKVDDVLVVQVKNINDGTVSNKLPISLTQFSVPNVTKLDFGEDYLEKTYFDFSVEGDGGFFGDAQKFEVNLNGTGYTNEGVKQVLKNKDGQVMKDAKGNELFDIVQKIDVKKDKNKFYFSFYTKDIGENNVFYFTNRTYEKTSNKVFFAKDFKKTDYAYVTGTTILPESLTFTKASDVEKNIDFLQKPEKDFSFGNIGFKDLKADSFYKVSFTLSSDSKINPFQEVKFGDEVLKMTQTEKGVDYTFEKIGYGKDFAQKDIIYNLNELFNIKNALNLKLTPLKLEVLSKTGTFETLYNDTNAKNISFLYQYHISNCFDGVNDFCDALKLGGDSYLDFILKFGTIVNISDIKEKTPVVTSDTQTPKTEVSLTSPTLDSDKIANKAKYAKQMILSKNKLEKSKSYKKLIAQIDKMVAGVSEKKGSLVLAKIAKINKEKLGDKKEIFEYLEAKIWSKINK